MTDNIVGKTVAVIVTAGTVMGIAYGAAKYVADFEAQKTEIANLRGQIVQLQDILGKVQVAQNGQAGPRGPKGDQGDPGPQGPRGEAGPQGIAGESLSETQLRTIVEQMLRAMPQQSARPVNNLSSLSADASNLLDTSKCVYEDDTRLPILGFTSGQEVCDTAGRAIARVGNVYTNGVISLTFTIPGDNKKVSCRIERNCALPWMPERTYYYEKNAKRDGENVAVFRLIK